MRPQSFILNLPYTILGILGALVSLPRLKIDFSASPYAIIFYVRSFWWTVGYMKHSRAMTMGHVVILGPETENRDLEHELIHVEQFSREPLIFPFLYHRERMRNGYGRKNKYEDEAYTRAGNIFKKP